MPHVDTSHEGRETLTGRAWLGCGAVAMVAVPLWLVLSAALIQLDPSLSGFQAILEGGDSAMHERPMLELWLVGGLRAAAIMAISVPVLIFAWLTVRAASAWLGRRERLDRERYDEMVRDAAVLRDTDWVDDRD